MLGQNLFAYCENMPVICIDISGYRKVYVIYYDDEERGFEDQAKNSAYYAINIDDVTLIGVTTNQEFIDAWNSIGDDADCIHLFVHGGEGVLHFKEESLRFPDAKNDTSSLSFADLEPKSVNGTVYLWSCDGGKGDVGNNVAFMFADLTNTYVHACTGHVSYTKYFGKYYARKSFKDLGMWHRFFYSESYFNPDLRYAVKF